MNIKKIINQELLNLNEVRYIQPFQDIENETPLKDNESIVVFHGFNKLSDAQNTGKFGISGKERAKRIYSYEAGNNPKGLFVTVDFRFAKDFSGGVIVEFVSKVSDLEAPVWAGGGSYFVQGQYTQSFNSPEEREDQRLKHREAYSKNEYEAIKNSDRPELAYALYEGPEKQALFTGDLNPNMIRAFWVNMELIDNRRHGGEWERLSKKEFEEKMLTDDRMKTKYLGDDKPRYSDDYYKKKNKMFNPADDYNPEIVKNKIKGFMTYDDFVNDYIKRWDNYIMNSYFYPKQIEQIKKLYPDVNNSVNEIILDEVTDFKLDETYKSVEEIKQLASNVIKSIAQNNIEQINDRGYLSYLYGTYLKNVDSSKYNELKGFIENSNIVITVDDKSDNNPQGKYVRPSTTSYVPRAEKEIEIFIENMDKLYEYIYDQIQKDPENYTVNDLYFDIYPELHSVLVHELQHAYDDYRSDTKTFQSKEAKQFEQKYENNINKDFKRYVKYLNLPHEIWARFSQAIINTSFVDINIGDGRPEFEMRPIREVLRDFQREFVGYKHLNDKMKRKLIGKVSQFWHYEKDKWDEKMKKRN